MSPVAAQLESVADRAFHSPWPPPAVPDVDLTSFALRDAPRMAGPYPIGEGEPVLGLAPFFHSMGLVCVLHHALASGGTVVCVARLELEGTLGALETHPRLSRARG